MALLTLWDGRVENVTDNRDMMYLVDEYMGMDARWWFEDRDKEQEDAEKELDNLWKDYEKLEEEHKAVIREIKAETDKLSDLLQQPRLNRKAINEAIKAIDLIVWRELK